MSEPMSAHAVRGPQLGPATMTSPIPFKREEAVGGANLSAGAIGLLVISLLAIVAVQIARKRLNLVTGSAATRTSLRVLESQRLGPKAMLTVVEFGGTQHLLAYSEHGLRTIASIPAAQPEAGAGR